MNPIYDSSRNSSEPQADLNVQTSDIQSPSYTDQPKERRKHHRRSARGDSFAMLEPETRIMGQIIDVSRGGLSFRYLPSHFAAQVRQRECALHILLADHSFYFDPLPCRVASDDRISQHEFGFSLLAMRRCSVSFLDLSEEQRSQLDYFVRNHSL